VNVVTAGAFELGKLDEDVFDKTKVHINSPKRKKRRVVPAAMQHSSENPENYWFAAIEVHQSSDFDSWNRACMPRSEFRWLSFPRPISHGIVASTTE
jgi:hypothetical protein